MSTTALDARSTSAATASLVLALLALGLSLTFFWFWGLPPALPLVASLVYAGKARRSGPAPTRVAVALVLDAIAAVDTVVLLAVNWGHLY